MAKTTVSSAVNLLNNARQDDDPRYYVVFYLGRKPLKNIMTEEIVPSLGFDLIGPVDEDPSLKVVNYADSNDVPPLSCIRLDGRPPEHLCMQATYEEWEEQKNKDLEEFE